jgi:hypothetical protein
MAKLTSKSRSKIKKSNFALPGRRYPVEDASHARNALARVSQFGSPSEKARVRAKVHSKYPGIGKKMKSGGVLTCKAYHTGGITHRV